MAEYGKDRYSKINSKSQSSRQYVADHIASEEKFNGRIKKQSLNYITGKALLEKDLMLSKGISYAYLDVLGEDLDNCNYSYKEHPFFIKGYEIGNRRRKIEGMNAYLNGVDLSLVSNEIKDHWKFIEGYTEAQKKDNKEGYKRR